MYLDWKLPGLRHLSISHQWLFPDLVEFKLVSRLFLKSVLWLLDKKSSLQLSTLDQVQAGSFLALRPSGSSHKRTLSTLQPALTQVPPTCAPHHHLHSSHSPGSELLRIYLRVTCPWKDLPPQKSSCAALSDPASRIFHPSGGSASSPCKHSNQLAFQ
ncbi:hypothetical protein CHARACLAT_002353 [Characodon lateralis]|uniref:Uncharacterized protein n=1 Tax=Characodon lateralis TaxID=208331 RepID=A0ABU7DPI9_9TELE|nr:hypothetical protein [Characodon lateralis]